MFPGQPYQKKLLKNSAIPSQHLPIKSTQPLTTNHIERQQRRDRIEALKISRDTACNLVGAYECVGSSLEEDAIDIPVINDDTDLMCTDDISPTSSTIETQTELNLRNISQLYQVNMMSDAAIHIYTLIQGSVQKRSLIWFSQRLVNPDTI